MTKLLLFAFIGSLAGLAGGLAGEVVLAGWPAVAGGLPMADTVAAYSRVAAWTACIGVVLAIGLVVGQNLYLRRCPIGLRQLLVVASGSLAAGLVAGVAGQAMQRALEAAAGSLSGGARTELAQGLGWMLLGGLLAACIAMFVPNLPKARAALAGAIGGGLGAWAFFDLSEWGGDTAGRLAGAAALGACVGSMLVAAERAFRKAWLEVVYGPKESRIVSLGGEPVTVGSAAGATIFARGTPAQVFCFRLQDGRVACDEVASGRTTTLSDGDVRQAGSLLIRVRGDRGAAVTGAGGGMQLVIAGQPPVPLRVGTALAARDIPGLAMPEGRGPVAEVVANPKRPGEIGLKNLSRSTWKLIRPQGEPADVPAGRVAGIQEHYRIDFGSVTGSFESAGLHSAGNGPRPRPPVRGSVAAIVATGLIAAGAADFHRRHPHGPSPVKDKSLPITILSLAQAGALRPLRLGVWPTKDGYDDIGVILKDMGQGYTYERLSWDDATKPAAALEKFDVLFMPCPGPQDGELSESAKKRVHDALRDYVSAGGTIYSSCLAWNEVADAFPNITGAEFRDREKRLGLKTKKQEVTAEVVDAGMREEFGDTVTLAFDLGGWYPPQFRGDGVTEYLRGSFDLECDIDILTADLNKKVEPRKAQLLQEEMRLEQEVKQLANAAKAGTIDQQTLEVRKERLLREVREHDAAKKAFETEVEQECEALVAVANRESRISGPLLAKMPFGDGCIIFTAFHNGKQRSRGEVELLRYLVYTTVTARLEARTKEQLVEAGFTAARHDLVTRSPGSPERKGAYKCSRPGRLRFALGFNGEGVRLRLDLTSPDGRTAVHATIEPVVVEVRDAAAGDWTYTVTAERLPSDNFPFTITIAEK